MSELENIDEKILDLIVLENEKKALKKQLAELEAQEEELKSVILPEMKNKSLKTFENEEIRITYVEETQREGIDNSMLKKQYPDIARECTKFTPVKENWKITLKENK